MSNMKINNDNEVIFIHSIFRASSTYIFKKFRENRERYTCYQEPVHEIGIMALDDHEVLNQDTGSEKNDQLRHPILEKSYFHELYKISDKALPYLNQDDIYDNYFNTNVESLCDYLNILVENSEHRCVIQECRLSSRMAAIKDKMAGTHLYLWRNPWDQWWSYKVTDYFDTVNLLILSASPQPDIIKQISEKINITKYSNDDLLSRFSQLMKVKLSAENSYLLFYAIWLSSLIEALETADYIFNIDKLSTCDDYKELVSEELNNMGIQGVDFSDCQVPQCQFTNKDVEFFSNIESTIHELFLESGYDSELLENVLAFKDEYFPKDSKLDANSILKDSERARELARNYMTELSICHQNLETCRQSLESCNQNLENYNQSLELEKDKNNILSVQSRRKVNKIEVKLARFETKTRNAEMRGNESEVRANEAEARANEAEARANEAEARANEAIAEASVALASVHAVEAKLSEAEGMINAILNSNSWRITKPIRFLVRLPFRIARKLKRLFLKVARRLIRYPIYVIIRNPTLKEQILKLIRKSSKLERFTRIMYINNNESSIMPVDTEVLTDRGNEILNTIKRNKKL
ncbi:hypothetical protein [Vibrio tasmaniensis]|uniref:hypothetical protein n=5 Tax=Vibrionaceae TaxID=641 RepID=UPI0010550550|nr:hypothetical protein [Vibrio tasmaniensis]